MTSRSLDEHRADVVARLTPLPPLALALADAVGCVLVADAVSADSVPPFAVAAHDGFAVRAADSRGAAMRVVHLPVTHDARPGAAPTRLLPGTSVRVARGAALPFGADAVVARSTENETELVLDAEVEQGKGVVPLGAVVAQGDVIVPAGAMLGPGHVAALASAGIATAVVRPSPRVAIIAVGGELSPAGAPLATARGPEEPVHEASGAVLSALVAAAGGRVARVVTVPDDPHALRGAIDDAAIHAELVVVLGGLSGDWSEVVRPVLEHAYAVTVSRVRLSPGGDHGIGAAPDGRGRDVPLIALPGHPVDTAAAFVGYVRDAIGFLKGLAAPLPHVPAGAAFASPYGFAHVVPVVRAGTADKGTAVPVGDAERPTLRDLATAEGLALVSEEATSVAARQPLSVLWWHA